MPPESRRTEAVRSPFQKFNDRQKEDVQVFMVHQQIVLTLYHSLGISKKATIDEAMEEKIRGEVQKLLKMAKIIHDETRKSI